MYCGYQIGNLFVKTYCVATVLFSNLTQVNYNFCNKVPTLDASTGWFAECGKTIYNLGYLTGLGDIKNVTEEYYNDQVSKSLLYVRNSSNYLPQETFTNSIETIQTALYNTQIVNITKLSTNLIPTTTVFYENVTYPSTIFIPTTITIQTPIIQTVTVSNRTSISTRYGNVTKTTSWPVKTDGITLANFTRTNTETIYSSYTITSTVVYTESYSYTIMNTTHGISEITSF